MLRAAALYAAAAWLLVQVAAQLFPLFDIPSWTVRGIVVFAVLVFPFWLVLSWFYGSVPGAPAAVQDQVPDSPVKQPATLGCVSAHERSIAVLPLAGESDQQFFSDGLSEDLITALSQMSGLKVISFNSSFQFRDRKESSVTIGEKLGVAHLLEGSVRRVGNVVRIRATLVRAADGSTLWSQHYDRPFDDLFALQDEITNAVASALHARLLPVDGASVQGNRPPSGNLEAYTAVLQGNFHRVLLSEESLPHAISEYNRAIRLDPRYAQAWAHLALARTELASRFLEGGAASETFALALDDARKALLLDAQSADAHIALGYALEMGRFEWTRAEPEYRMAMALAPDSVEPKLALAWLLASFGRPGESVTLVHEALKLDPLNVRAYTNLALFEFGRGQLDAAEDSLQKAISLQPNAAMNYKFLSFVNIQRGRADAALRHAQRDPSESYRDVAVACALQIGTDRAAADAGLAQLIDKYGDHAAYQVAQAYALRGDPEHAFLWLDRAWSAHDGGIRYLLYDPFLRPYREDPRFAAFCRKIGVPEPSLATDV